MTIKICEIKQISLVTHCRVLPHGEFNGMILEPFSIYSGSFIIITVSVAPATDNITS